MFADSVDFENDERFRKQRIIYLLVEQGSEFSIRAELFKHIAVFIQIKAYPFFLLDLRNLFQ
ncbi:hypothetical protein D3C85_1110380 [compost metagenome]